MTDERYKERAAIHTETVVRTNQLLDASNTDAERWLELAKKTFSTATNLGDVFQIANDAERRRLMMYIGSNWYLTNKKVALTDREPLNLLHNRASETSWRTVVEEVWNYFSSSYEAGLNLTFNAYACKKDGF